MQNDYSVFLIKKNFQHFEITTANLSSYSHTMFFVHNVHIPMYAYAWLLIK